MKKAVKGKFCGDFTKPTTPFQSQPFFGHYSRRAASRTTETGTQGTATGLGMSRTRRPPRPRTPRPTPATRSRRSAKAAPGSIPNKYETPPQQPDPKSPGGAQAPADG